MIISNKYKKIPLLIAMVLSIAVVSIFIYMRQNITHAADVSKFDPGNIMSDAVMSNKNTMDVQQIQAFLNSKNRCNNTNTHMAGWYPHLQYTIRDGKFVCMAQDTFGGKSAAQIIWQVAQDYSINPQFLIVLLEKEQGLVSDTWPNHVQYRTATGFGCPDTAPCDSQYFGLENQLRQAANLFRAVLNGGWSNYPVGYTYVQYNPNAACGGSVINIQNRATSALYRYTPYQPNQSALNAGYGSGDSCGAYGNRNTWMLFNDWFGNTHNGIHIDVTKATHDIKTTYNRYRTQLGSETTSIITEYEGTARVWQSFQNGTIIWTEKSGAHPVINSGISNRWREIGGSNGNLGVPTSSPITEHTDGRVWQDFQKGTIIESSSTGAWEVENGPLSDKWRNSGGSLGVLGKPTSGVSISESMRKQSFEHGTITRKGLNSPAYMIYGNTYQAWQRNLSDLGAPSMDAVREKNDNRVWQEFEKGLTVDNGSDAWVVRHGDFNNRWRSLGGSTGKLGKPASNQTQESDGRIWQNFDNGTLIKRRSSDPVYDIIFGNIHTRWRQTGGSIGELGVPVSSAYTESDGRTWQNFSNGVIISSTTTGTWDVYDGFYKFWTQQGGSLGKLGKPTGEKKIEKNGTRWQNFEKATAQWSPELGWKIETIN